MVGCLGSVPQLPRFAMGRPRGIEARGAPLRGAFRSACAAGTVHGRRGRGCRDIDAAHHPKATGRLPCTSGPRRAQSRSPRSGAARCRDLRAARIRPARAGRRPRASGPRPGRCFVGADQPRGRCVGSPTRPIAGARQASPWLPEVEAPPGEGEGRADYAGAVTGDALGFAPCGAPPSEARPSPSPDGAGTSQNAASNLSVATNASSIALSPAGSRTSCKSGLIASHDSACQR